MAHITYVAPVAHTAAFQNGSFWIGVFSFLITVIWLEVFCLLTVKTFLNGTIKKSTDMFINTIKQIFRLVKVDWSSSQQCEILAYAGFVN